MPLFEPTLPADRIPKPKKKRKARKRRATKLNTGRLWAVLACVLGVVLGVSLIVAYLARVAAGNPPQGEWGLTGVMIVFMIFLFVILDATEGRNWRGRR